MNVAIWLISTGVICIAATLFVGFAIHNGMNDNDSKDED